MIIQPEVRQDAPALALKAARESSCPGEATWDSQGRLSCWTVPRQSSSRLTDLDELCIDNEACRDAGAAPAQQAGLLFTGVLLKGAGAVGGG